MRSSSQIVPDLHALTTGLHLIDVAIDKTLIGPFPGFVSIIALTMIYGSMLIDLS